MGYTHGVQWDDEKIKREIIKVKDALKLNRMPTRGEMRAELGNDCLTCAISKRKGYYGYARELNLEIKDSCTTTGKEYERVSADILRKMGFKVEQMPQNYPYDLLVEDFVKVDVKASHMYRGKGGHFFSFRIGKPFATCDIYLFLELSEDDEIERIMVIPSKFIFYRKQIGCGKSSVYNKFTNRFDYIADMAKYFHEID